MFQNSFSCQWSLCPGQPKLPGGMAGTVAVTFKKLVDIRFLHDPHSVLNVRGKVGHQPILLFF